MRVMRLPSMNFHNIRIPARLSYPSILRSVAALLVFLTAACSGQNPAAPLVTPPAISVLITGGFCPSMEVQAGMQVAWTNLDEVDRVVILERTNDQGVVVESGGTDSLQPGQTFSITMTEAGQYTVYCSEDRTAAGRITVLPGSYP